MRELNHALGPDSKFTHVDVTDRNAVGRWAQGIFEDGGPPDLLLNNAALMNTPAELWNVPSDEFSQLVDVNIKEGQRYRETDYVQSGDRLAVSDLPWGKLGLTVCYDLRFSHLYRLLAQSGAIFITIPSAFTYKTGKAHWEVLVRARAIESGSFIFAPSQCGVRSWGRKTYGHSLIVNPWGEIMADGGMDEGFITAEIDSLATERCRKMIPSLLNDDVFRASI